jgi:hypothetical protein
MVRRADAAYQEDMRRAGHDALLECDGATFEGLADAEATRIEGIIRRGERPNCTCVIVCGQRHYGDADERMTVRRRAITVLRRLASDGHSSLDKCSDEQLLAEITRRGLMPMADV